MQIFALLLALSASAVLGKKNAQEEAICQPFLTSRATSPLMPNLNRNVTFDEDGEFACELVLQDTDLPVQIRATIHEGLGWLAIRHIQMGLVKEKVASRHFSLLSELSPKTFDFAFKAGMFMLAPSVSNNKDALKYLQRAIANTDPSKVSPADHHQLHHLFVKALRRAQRHEEAEAELYKLLERYPYDFETLAVLKYGSMRSAEHHAEFGFLESLYRDVQVHGESEYVGFRPPCAVTADAPAWQPTVYAHVLSEADFVGHVERREPFLVRMGSTRSLSAALGWNTEAWRGDAGRAYLRKAVGDSELVLVESRAHHATEATTRGESFGFGLNVHRKLLPFDQVLENDFTNEYGNESIYLNIQQPQTTGDTHRTPLHLLQQDIPPPAMLGPVWSNVTEVNLWMGVARDRDSQSALHFDATDNLYVVLEGSKRFSVVSPADALNIDTVSPSYAVSPDGLSFQFNVLKFREYALRKARGEIVASDIDISGAASTNGTARNGLKSAALLPATLQARLLNEEIDYDVSNFHFSAQPASTYSAANCGAGPTEFDLNEGDMLYLPTGWLHQVTSRQGKHLAVNYWWRALNWRGAVDFERERSEALYDKLLA